LDGAKIAAIAGDLVEVESVYALKELLTKMKSPNMECRQDGAQIDPSNRAGYLFNTTIAGIEQADVCLIIGSDVRREAPLIMSRLRKRYLQGGFKVASIGPESDLPIKFEHLGDSAVTIEGILAGKLPFAETLKNAKKPMLILGMGALRRPDGAAVLAKARELAEKFNMVRPDWNGFNVLQLAAGRTGALDVGFVPQKGGADLKGIYDGCLQNKIEAVYLLGADEIDMARLANAFVIYQGHHGDAGAHRADVILPGAAYTEKDGIYVNTEGRPQHGHQAILPPGQAKEDWKIIRALSDRIGFPLPFNTLDMLRDQLIAAYPMFGSMDKITPATWGKFGTDGNVTATAFVYPLKNYYMTDPISRASVTMAQCTDEFMRGKKEAA
jgi:NADH-quinone oxidoreductase subunit G